MARERILLVEDEKLIRWSVKSRLEEDGFLVEEAEKGRDDAANSEGYSKHP